MPATRHVRDSSVDEPGTSRPSRASGPLTDRELDVVRYLPTRAVNPMEIAGQFGISPNTVKSHLKAVYQKLGVRSRNEAIVKAGQLHVISDVSTALVTKLAKRSPALASR